MRDSSDRRGDSATQNNSPFGNSQALPQDVRLDMERQLGGDFRNVRVYPSSFAHGALESQAYTQGTDLHFAPGEYAPYSTGGRELLGHELAHVVQQGSGRVRSPQG